MPPAQNSLTLEDRVAYERAIQEVYWRHRIWPKENPQAKPALDQVMPLSALRAKVEDYLGKAQALEVYWQRPITGAQLQAEMDRMARQTKQPAMLKELWAGLGNDPYVIAECMARPALANRLIRNWYAYDQRYHGALKSRAESDLRAYGTVSQMRAMSGAYRELHWMKAENHLAGVGAPLAAPEAGQDAPVLNSEQWAQRVHELAQLFSPLTPDPSPTGSRRAGPGEGAEPAELRAELDRLPVGQLSPLQEDDERFYVAAVLEKGSEQLKVATVEWRKEPFDTWWGKGRDEMQGQVPAPGYAYGLAPIASVSGSCADDTWTPTLALPVSARSLHTAVWTGSEMIVWGGRDTLGYLNTGGRYDPASDSWTGTSTGNVPSARLGHTAVWTGSEMIVWGRYDVSGLFNTGGRYDPATDTWTATTTTNAPTPRANHSTVWTGSEMIVWGGADRFTYFNTGGRYDPAIDTWMATSTTNAPSARDFHTAVWTGSEMIVWGGRDTLGYLNTGGRYDPASDSWTGTSTGNVPSARLGHDAVWTGSEMIVWGGGLPITNTGGRYDPATDTWTATNTSNAPSAREFHTAVWSGSEMIVWGGFRDYTSFNSGGRYDPTTDTWTPTSTSNAPTARDGHTAVWTGSEMIVWGGSLVSFPTYFDSGGRYDPANDRWTATATNNAPSARVYHTAVWTGSEMIVWGGYDVSSLFNTGGRYDPATDTWTATTTTNAPSARDFHTAVWTGSEMIVWGGIGDSGLVNTGGRYDPATDSWVATNTSDAASRRSQHTAVWTGSQMIIWGGSAFPNFLNTGGRYDPATDSWRTMSNAPSARHRHTRGLDGE